MKNYLKFAAGVMVAGVALSAQAGTTAICGGTAGSGTAVDAATDGTTFVRTAFKPQCSQNVLLSVDQSSTAIWGAAASKKGKNVFGGSSNGGAVRAVGTCASTGCATAEINTGIGVAATFGSS